MNTSCKFDDEMEERIRNLLSGTESPSQFVYKAAEEKVNRMESRNIRAKDQRMEKDKRILTPVIKEILKEEGLIE